MGGDDGSSAGSISRLSRAGPRATCNWIHQNRQVLMYLACPVTTCVDVSPCQALVQMVFQQTQILKDKILSGKRKALPPTEMDLVELFHETCTLDRSLSGPVEDAFASKDIRVLRNLSKREYVRSNGKPWNAQSISLNGTPGLEQVLLSAHWVVQR
jgi:hypothetical protein